MKNKLIVFLVMICTFFIFNIDVEAKSNEYPTYKYLSEKELKENGWSPMIAKEVNDFNKKHFSVFNEYGKELNIYNTYDEITIEKFKEVKLILNEYELQVPNKLILDNIDDFEVFFNDELTLSDLYDNYFNKYDVYDVDYNLINASEFYGEKLYAQLPRLKKNYIHLSNKEILDNIQKGNKALSKLNFKNSLKYKIIIKDEKSNKFKVVNGYDVHGQYIMQYLKNNKSEYKYLTNSEILEIYLFGKDELERFNQIKKIDCEKNNKCKTRLMLNR